MTTLDPRELRSAFGRFMTGVAIVTTRNADGTPLGFTANSFTSVSLDPPLLLVCPGKFLSSFEAFNTCTHFAVSILAEGQETISNVFAGYKGDRFAQVAHRPDLNGIPLIDGAVAQFSCRTWQSIPAGDHHLLIGEVMAFSERQARGLGYVGGQYFSLGLERAALEHTAGTAIYGAIIAVEDKVILEQTPSGFRPPQIKRDGRGNFRQDLSDHLAEQRLDARLGPTYSVFDDAQTQTHYVYCLASGLEAPQTDTLRAVPAAELPTLNYVNPAIAAMMRRYALEVEAQSFGLYFGDSESGDIHSLSERS